MIFFLSWIKCWKKTSDFLHTATFIFKLHCFVYWSTLSHFYLEIMLSYPPLKEHSVSIFRRKFRHVKYIHKYLDAEKNVSFSSFQIRILKFWLIYEILYHTNMSLRDNCKFSNITRSEGWVGATWAELLATQAELRATQAWVTRHPVQNASWVTRHPPFFSRRPVRRNEYPDSTAIWWKIIICIHAHSTKVSRHLMDGITPTQRV